jgi:hypothetical protein
MRNVFVYTAAAESFLNSGAIYSDPAVIGFYTENRLFNKPVYNLATSSRSRKYRLAFHIFTLLK